jgi:ABC-type dipeptide/oligopeptide/nickel transport system permease component
MLRYIINRLLLLIPVLLGISLVVLILIDFTPGDPARMMLGAQASQEQVDALREELGLNDPLPVRYGRFLWGVVNGDFGTSLMTKRPVIDEMLERFPYTLTLVTIGIIFSVFLGIPIGIYAATHRHTWKDNAAIFLALIAVSMPSFWFALLLIRFFAVQLGWLPYSGVESWKGWILPCGTMALGISALIARQVRSDMLEVLRQDYITTARAKGLSERRVIYRHALKNAMIPVIMVIGGVFGSSLGGSLITEMIYSIPGLGQYIMTALNNRDYPVIQSGILIGSIAGYYGGWVDNLSMRLLDIYQAIPMFLLSVSLAAIMGPSLKNAIIALGVGTVPGYARIMRASVLTVREKEFVEAARAINGSNTWIIFKHIVPNAIGPLIVQITMGVGACVLAGSALSYIGLGAQPPIPEWGAMIADARSVMRQYPTHALYPGICVMITVLACNLLGDGLRDALDPRLKN